MAHSPAAKIALVRPFPAVDPFVLHQFRPLQELPAANVAFEEFMARVHAHMTIVMASRSERFPAQLTFQPVDAGDLPHAVRGMHMAPEVTKRRPRFSADIAYVRPGTVMRVDVLEKNLIVGESPAANEAKIRFLHIDSALRRRGFNDRFRFFDSGFFGFFLLPLFCKFLVDGCSGMFPDVFLNCGFIRYHFLTHRTFVIRLFVFE